ncbi:hypothetical protein CO674_15435 [Rhizobium hidalgonense]|uniref:Helix-turn-helix domain-containing protein n=2 Tax=Rhizobium hidalgonense TaxID=1538159 RepID=A0ABX4JUP2_9HYPH|nr:hypothetical protein CO674_15435 [Rhizobium hidalgonense]
MCRLREAARRALCDVDEVLELLVEGKLEHVSFNPDELFEGVLVSADELRAKTKVSYDGWVHSDEVALRLDISHNDAADLMRKGTLCSEHVNYRFGTVILTTKKAVDEFDRRYLSVSAIAEEKGKAAAEVVRKFGKAGVRPAIRSSCGRSLFFYRHELDP